MLKRTTKPLIKKTYDRRRLAKSSKKQHSQNTHKWHLCKAGFFKGESLRTPPLEGTSLHRWNNSVERPWGILSLFTTRLQLWVKSHRHLLPHLHPKKQSAEHAPKGNWEKRSPINAEKKKLVLGFLHSVNHTGSPLDKSYIHSYFVPGQNNKSSKCKFKKKKEKSSSPQF